MKRCWDILLRQAVRCSSGCMRTQVEDTPFGTQLFFGVKFSGARLRSASEIEHWLPKDRATGSGGVLRTARDSFELRDQYSGFQNSARGPHW